MHKQTSRTPTVRPRAMPTPKPRNGRAYRIPSSTQTPRTTRDLRAPGTPLPATPPPQKSANADSAHSHPTASCPPRPTIPQLPRGPLQSRHQCASESRTKATRRSLNCQCSEQSHHASESSTGPRNAGELRPGIGDGWSLTIDGWFLTGDGCANAGGLPDEMRCLICTYSIRPSRALPTRNTGGRS
ncbi:hypothetical protein KC19_VG211100 [Ceratodon purpureus]|uniref:Uncharacterized protein n=1 Tax=Ceratodon purpureus TaxID=3225 RepID=A0A8T0HS33_CERPU|nr:hypothetical protein KC19_VG211100 [Ceratodon purpureus]